MSARPVRGVILDYSGVVQREASEDWDEVAARYGVPAGWAWKAVHDIPEYAASREGRISRAAFRSAVVATMARWIGAEDAERLRTELEGLARARPPIEPEMKPLLTALRSRVRLGLLTNGSKGSLAILEERGVLPWFDDVVASGDVGLAKPDPRVFHLAAQRLGVEPGECAFVDDLERNVLGAREAGLLAHHHHHSRHDALVSFLVHVGALPPVREGPHEGAS